MLERRELQQGRCSELEPPPSLPERKLCPARVPGVHSIVGCARVPFVRVGAVWLATAVQSSAAPVCHCAQDASARPCSRARCAP